MGPRLKARNRFHAVQTAAVCVCSLWLVLSGPAAQAGAGKYPPIRAVVHSQTRINGIDMHLAEAGGGPLVILLHGFPELWFSWRYQMPVLADGGFHAVAPDMRGYGDTARPVERNAYDILHQCADIIGIMKHFDDAKAVLVGHDWGAAIAVQCARLYPDRVRALVTISVPYGAPLSKRLPTEALRERYGDDFFYMLYFQDEAAGRELNSRTAELFRKFYVTPGTPRAEPLVTDKRAAAGGFLDRIGEPLEAPDWITPQEIRHYVRVFERTGFTGGLNYYRNLDRNALILREMARRTYHGPALFVAGAEDFLVAGRTSKDLEESMRAVTPRVSVSLLPSVGHWTMEQAPDKLNRLLLDFLSESGESEAESARRE